MPDYAFKSLTWYDFEKLMADILSSHYHEKFSYFKPGKDGGVDLLAFTTGYSRIIAQCKHYADSGLRLLLSKLKEEVPKVAALKPVRYIVATSVALSFANKTKIQEMFSPFILRMDDIWGKEDINQALGKDEAIQRRHPKLWLTSEAILLRLLHSSVYNISEVEKENIALKARLFVQGKSFEEARKILEASHCLIIAGNPGIGKSTLAEMLCLYYIDREFEIIKISGDVREGIEVDSHTGKQIFYYDDFLGQGYIPELSKNEDQIIIDFAGKIRLSHSKRFILTTREYMLEEAKMRRRR